MPFTEFPTVIQQLLQAGFLVRELEEGLDSTLAYRAFAAQEEFPGSVGESLTRTRKGRKAPVVTPLATNSNTGLDNGLVSSQFTTEQYTFTLREYADTVDLNLMQNEAQIADQFIANARNNGVQAAQSLERICRQKLFDAYLSGNTKCITLPVASILAPDGAANSQTNINVDDVRGFQTVLVSGVVTPVSVANPLAIVLTVTATGVTVALSVTAATPYGYEAGMGIANITTTPGAIPGALTTVTGSGVTPLSGDTVVAVNAPAILRPLGKLNAGQITGGDVLSLGIAEDAVAYLRDNAIPPMDDGTYHMALDNTSMRQLFADQDFKILFAGRSQSPEYREGDIIRLLGITYVPTTEAYVQAQVTFNGTVTANTGVKIRRPIIAGAEVIIQANFAGMATWLRNIGAEGSRPSVAMVDGVVQIVREPLDRLQQIVAQSWTWIGDYAVPTDLTATTSIIPTASNALYKRAVVIEHAG